MFIIIEDVAFDVGDLTVRKGGDLSRWVESGVGVVWVGVLYESAWLFSQCIEEFAATTSTLMKALDCCTNMY